MLTGFKKAVKDSFSRVKREIRGLYLKDKAHEDSLKRIQKVVSDLKDNLSLINSYNIESELNNVKKLEKNYLSSLKNLVKAKDFFKVISSVEESLEDLNEDVKNIKLSSNLNIYEDVNRFKKDVISLKSQFKKLKNKVESNIDVFSNEISSFVSKTKVDSDLKRISEDFSENLSKFSKTFNNSLEKLSKEVYDFFNKKVEKSDKNLRDFFISSLKDYKKEFSKDIKALIKSDKVLNSDLLDVSKRSEYNFNELNKLRDENHVLSREIKSYKSEISGLIKKIEILEKKIDKFEKNGRKVEKQREESNSKEVVRSKSKSKIKSKVKAKAKVKIESEANKDKKINVLKKKDKSVIVDIDSKNSNEDGIDISSSGSLDGVSVESSLNSDVSDEVVLFKRSKKNSKKDKEIKITMTHKTDPNDVYIQPWSKIGGYKKVKKNENDF